MNAARSDSVDFFLGTTTPAGFKGYFEPLRREPYQKREELVYCCLHE